MNKTIFFCIFSLVGFVSGMVASDNSGVLASLTGGSFLVNNHLTYIKNPRIDLLSSAADIKNCGLSFANFEITHVDSTTQKENIIFRGKGALDNGLRGLGALRQDITIYVGSEVEKKLFITAIGVIIQHNNQANISFNIRGGSGHGTGGQGDPFSFGFSIPKSDLAKWFQPDQPDKTSKKQETISQDSSITRFIFPVVWMSIGALLATVYFRFRSK